MVEQSNNANNTTPSGPEYEPSREGRPVARFASRPRSWLIDLLWSPRVEKMKKEKDVDGLLQALEHPKPKVRWAVMRALGELWDMPDVIDLGHRDPDVRAQAAEALGQLDDQRAVAPLIASLWDPELVYYAEIRYFYPVRINAIETLGKIGDSMAVEPLIEALRRNSWGYPARGDEPLYTSLVQMGDPMFVRLTSLLQDDERHMRDLAMRALEHFDDPRIIEPLGNALRHERDGLLKGLAAQVLYQIGKEQSVPELITSLQQEEDPMLQLDIVSFLSKVQDERIVPALIDTFRRADTSWREMMIKDVVRFGSPEALAAVEAYQRGERSSELDT